MDFFSALSALCVGNSPVTGALMFSLIWPWINGWVNNREAGDLRRHRAHYDVIIIRIHGRRQLLSTCPTQDTIYTPCDNIWLILLHGKLRAWNQVLNIIFVGRLIRWNTNFQRTESTSKSVTGEYIGFVVLYVLHPMPVSFLNLTL